MTHHHTPLHTAQSGMSLIFALLALVARSLGAVALIRSVDTGTLVLGNLGFKQDATVSADKATENAISFLNACSDLNTDSNSSSASVGCNQLGYYASSHDGVDATGQQSSGTAEMVDWEGDDKCSFSAHTGACTLNPRTVPTDTNGGKTQYVIFRLCNATGVITSDSACIKPPNNSGSSTKRGKSDYAEGGLRFLGNSGPYYRVVVRSVSGRNTASFTETIVHF